MTDNLPTLADLKEAMKRALPTRYVIGPYNAFALIGQIQLASRHPGNKGQPADIAREFADHLTRDLPEVVQQVIAVGWDPAQDESEFGALGTHPAGKLDPHDEGALKFGIAADPDRDIVHVEFGTPVTWLGLNADLARRFAAMLISNADKLAPPKGGHN
ncbi:MAG: hypothetical protein OXC11_02400 [Rhodospirillales bacterium]|nr:hypothetical protein [Rhodospirillales bacterium]